MSWLYAGFLLASLPSAVTAQANKTVKVCISPGNTVNYTCEVHQMIHVISKLYQEASDPYCVVLVDACKVEEDSLDEGFTTECNGKVTCSEDLSTFKINTTCGNITTAVATVSYECVTDPPIDVCNNTVVSSGNTDTLYLASHNYPARIVDNTMTDTCECNITGTDMIVEILEIHFLFDPSVRANLTLTGDTGSWESHPNTFLMYNHIAIRKISTLRVVFDAYGRSSQRMWIRLKGTPEIKATCNYDASATSPLTTLPVTTSATSMSAPTGTPTKQIPTSTFPAESSTDLNRSTKPGDAPNTAEPNTVAIAVGCVFAVLIAAAIVIVVIFIMMRRKRLKPYLSSHDDDQYGEGSMKHVEAYQMSLASREAAGSKPSENGHGPSSPDYAEIEPLGTTKTGAGDASTSVSKSSRNSRGPSNSDYVEIQPLGSTKSSNGDDIASSPSPHYYVLEPMGTTKTDAGHDSASGSKPSDAGRSPGSSEYAEPDTLGITKTDAKQRTNPERMSGDASAPNKSSVPYTNKRLEELYAKVVPKKFRSTRDMREAEKKTNAKESKSKRKSDTSINGITNDAYDNADEKTDNKHKGKTKDRRSRSKSVPDYQEIGTVSVSQRGSNASPPVPPKVEGTLDELGTGKAEGDTETYKISNKSQKGRSSSSDARPNSEPEMQNEAQVQSRADSDNKGQSRSGDGANASADGADNDDKLVIVDNVLYQGAGPEQGGRNDASDNTHRKSSANTSADGTDSDDKLVMVDNVLYEGAGPEQGGRNDASDNTHRKSSTNTSADGADSDDKLVMVDNVLYQGAGPEQGGRNDASDNTHRKSSGPVAKGSEYEDIKDDSLSSRPVVSGDMRPERPAQYEDIIII